MAGGFVTQSQLNTQRNYAPGAILSPDERGIGVEQEDTRPSALESLSANFDLNGMWNLQAFDVDVQKMYHDIGGVLAQSAARSMGDSAAFSNPQPLFRDDAAFDPYDPELLDTSIMRHYPDEVEASHSLEEFRARETALEREREARNVQANTGLGMNLLTGLAVGATSPVNLIPFASAMSWAKGGTSILRYFGAAAVTAGLSNAVEEIPLQMTQQMRSFEESAMAVGAGAVFGGVIGAGVGTWATKVAPWMRRSGIDSISRHFDQPPIHVPKVGDENPNTPRMPFDESDPRIAIRNGQFSDPDGPVLLGTNDRAASTGAGPDPLDIQLVTEIEAQYRASAGTLSGAVEHAAREAEEVLIRVEQRRAGQAVREAAIADLDEFQVRLEDKKMRAIDRARQRRLQNEGQDVAAARAALDRDALEIQSKQLEDRVAVLERAREAVGKGESKAKKAARAKIDKQLAPLREQLGAVRQKFGEVEQGPQQSFELGRQGEKVLPGTSVRGGTDEPVPRLDELRSAAKRIEHDSLPKGVPC